MLIAGQEENAPQSFKEIDERKGHKSWEKAIQEEIDMNQSTKKGQYKRTRYKMDIYKERGKRKTSIQS